MSSLRRRSPPQSPYHGMPLPLGAAKGAARPRLSGGEGRQMSAGDSSAGTGMLLGRLSMEGSGGGGGGVPMYSVRSLGETSSNMLPAEFGGAEQPY